MDATMYQSKSKKARIQIVESIQNITIEERVEILEGQVIVIEEDVTEPDQDVNFLYAEQIIQDERILDLEVQTGNIDDQLVLIDDNISSKLVLFIVVEYIIFQ